MANGAGGIRPAVRPAAHDVQLPHDALVVFLSARVLQHHGHRRGLVSNAPDGVGREPALETEGAPNLYSLRRHVRMTGDTEDHDSTVVGLAYPGVVVDLVRSIQQ